MDTIRVLLAEDHRIVREGMRVLLEQTARIVIVGEAENGEEAVRLAAELQPDVVVMNVCMPGLDGIEATKAIKAQQPDLPILAISAHDDDQFVFPLLDAGGNGYLLKTTSASELIRAIYIVHTGGTALDPNIASKVVNRLKRKRLSHYGDPLEGLTQRELEVLRIAAHGKSSKEIGQALSISPLTVQAHMRNIYAKLEVGSRAEAVAHALQQGWITLRDRTE